MTTHLFVLDISVIQDMSGCLPALNHFDVNTWIKNKNSSPPPKKKTKPKTKTQEPLNQEPSLKFLFFFYFLYLAAPGLSCGMRTLSCSMGELVPQLGIELGPLLWEHGATGPPGKSPHFTDFGLDHFSCFGQWNVNRYDSCHV